MRAGFAYTMLSGVGKALLLIVCIIGMIALGVLQWYTIFRPRPGRKPPSPTQRAVGVVLIVAGLIVTIALQHH